MNANNNINVLPQKWQRKFQAQLFAPIRNSLILAIIAASLSACLSSALPTDQQNAARLDGEPVETASVDKSALDASPIDVAQPGQSSLRNIRESGQGSTNPSSEDVGKQLLIHTDDGILVSIPAPNPVKIVTTMASGSLNSPQKDNIGQNSIPADLKLAQQKNQPANSAILARVDNDQPVSTEKITNQATPDALPVIANENGLGQQAKKKPGFLARLFQRSRNGINRNNKPVDDRESAILLSSRTASMSNRVTLDPPTAYLATIPGKKASGAKFATGNVQIASAAGMVRSPVSKLRTQHSRVNVDCILPEVMQLVKVVERRYGKVPIVTSGYRSPSRNRNAGGARNSMHIYCKAVDIQVEGVSKWKLAKFLRTVPGRGGVGTYCRTNSVHIDSGPKRDWHYSCRRKSKLRRKT